MKIPPEISAAINLFISGEDSGLNAANRLEVLLDDCFPDDDYVQEAVEMLALYRPGGGEYLFDLDDIIPRLRGILNRDMGAR